MPITGSLFFGPDDVVGVNLAGNQSSTCEVHRNAFGNTPKGDRHGLKADDGEHFPVGVIGDTRPSGRGDSRGSDLLRDHRADGSAEERLLHS